MGEPDRTGEVSARVSGQALAAAEQLGWPVRPDWAALGVDEARLRGPGGRIAWREYVAMLAALGGPGADARRHAELGALVMRHSVDGPFRQMGQLLSGAEALYRGVYGWILHSTITVVRAEVSTVAPRRLRVEIRLDADAAPGEVFFWGTCGTMRVLPRVLGLAEAVVDADVTSHAATYDVRLPPSLTLAARLGRARDALFDREGIDDAMAHFREGMVAMVEELRETNARLAASEARWRAVTESLPGLVAVMRPDGTFERVYGTAGQPGDDGDAIWARVLDEDQPAALAALARCHAEQVQVEAEVRTRRPADGQIRSWACRGAPLPGGSPRVAVVALDVSEQRAAEAALRESERRYLRAQGAEVVGRFAGGIAHDVNNVLAAVCGQAEILRTGVADPAEVARRAERILAATQRCAALTRRVLASVDARPSPSAVVDLHAALRESAAFVQRLIGEDVALVLALAPEPVHVFLDPTAIERILLNLAVNARDAMPSGGRLALTTAVEGWEVVLTVRDDGVGMPPEVLARAFEPFFTTKAAGVGTGLGLTTVRELVLEAGGAISAESAPGAGTAIHVRLPVVDAAAVPARPETERAVVRGAGQRVVLVEDQEPVREAVRAMLERLDYRVVAALSCGEEALAHFDGGAGGDVLVTDIVMPGMSGVDLARALRRHRPDLPILLVSGFPAEDPTRAADLGPRQAYLRKPFGLVDLSVALAALIGR